MPERRGWWRGGGRRGGGAGRLKGRESPPRGARGGVSGVSSFAGKSTPVECVRGGFIGFHVSAGKHHVRVTYRPYSFYGSLIVTLIAAVALIFPKSWNRTPVHAVVTGP